MQVLCREEKRNHKMVVEYEILNKNPFNLSWMLKWEEFSKWSSCALQAVPENDNTNSI